MRNHQNRLGKLEIENAKEPKHATLNPWNVHGAITALQILENGRAISKTDLLAAVVIPGGPESTSGEIIRLLISLGAIAVLPGGMLRPTSEFLQKRKVERDRWRREDELRTEMLREFYAKQKAAGRYVPDGY